MIEEYFGTVSGEDDWTPRYNIAPTQPVPVVRQNPKEPRRELSLFRWGLIPSWANDMSGAAVMINARSETAATKPAFRRGAPASLHFYEIRTAFVVGDKIA
jgi:putative SOS response-associated peptidase YedK